MLFKKPELNKLTCVRAAFMAVFIMCSLPGVEAEAADPFMRGQVSLSVAAGGGRAFGENYAVFGVGAGYYVLDGLEVGLGVDAWLGSSPDIYTISPQFRYVFHTVPRVKPYAGAFYKHTYIEGLDDLDAFGVRGGVYFMIGQRSYLGVGAVYDSYVDCDKDIYSSCTNTYPEVTFSFAF